MNMKKALILSILISLCVGVSSCKKETIQPEEPFLKLDTPSTITFDAKGGEQTISFHTDENWSVDYSGDWFQLSQVKGIYNKTGNSITITCYENGYVQSRSCTITIMTSKCNVTISINQEGDKAIIFKDENLKKLLVSSHFDYYPDNEITYLEAEKVDIINCIKNEDIKSFDDLIFFTNLKGLAIWHNPVTEIDLSKNTKLEELDIWDTQLRSINLHNNNNLTRLHVNSSQLSSLDLSHNTNLTGLECCFNQLESLDVSNNNKLVYLKCFGNKISSLDLSKNNLINWLECAENQLTNLLLGNNECLEYLRCQVNHLTTLDVSQLPSLLDFDCYSNDLKSLDISNNIKIEQLSCFENPSLKQVWVKEGQNVKISYDDSVTTIYYK